MGQAMGIRPHLGDALPFAFHSAGVMNGTLGASLLAFLFSFPYTGNSRRNPQGTLKRKAMENGMIGGHGFKPSVWRFLRNCWLSDFITSVLMFSFPPF